MHEGYGSTSPWWRAFVSCGTWVRARLTGALLERRLGLTTGRHVSVEELGLAVPGAKEYVPSAWQTLERVLPPHEVGSEDVFVDLGAGMGRVLLLAGRYPFKRVIGVELSSDLANVARENLARAQHVLRCDSIDVVVADARRWAVPDDVTVVYMYNPLTGDAFGDVLQRLLESVDRRCRCVRLIYRNPREHCRVMATGRARLVRHWKEPSPLRRHRGADIRVYDLLPNVRPGGAGADVR